MPRQTFSHVRTWVFDLDNTLYPADVRLFDQIEQRMTTYVMEALGVGHDHANHLRNSYWHRYGTTLAGLMEEHGLDPEPYLADVHDIDLTDVPACDLLRAAITALPGRRIVYTNGSREHARRVTRARGLDGVFDALYGVEDAGYRPKPHADAFAAVFAADRLDPETAAMFEDDPRNLEVPRQLGMGTVLVGSDTPATHAHFTTTDLTAFLEQLA